ncbi:MAG: aspartate carbamoyltransferase, partial [Candidatus Ranarchaeia archaeon]
MNFKGRNLITLEDYSNDEILHILEIAKNMEKSLAQGVRHKDMDGIVLATLFFEPSTRTKFSFESAMYRLGGNVLSLSDVDASSVTKGESLIDTLRTIRQYADMIVLRHPKMGAARLATSAVDIPIINAGDGSGQHPTQTLLDLYTIMNETKGTQANIALMGDLKYGRTVHSLSKALARFNKKLTLISPSMLKMPDEILHDLEKKGVEITQTQKLDTVLPSLDVLYVTRIQKERFPDPQEYVKLKGVYQITLDTLQKARKELAILHPLPRVGEIAYEVDDTPHAKYFKQMYNGLVVRMALLGLIAGVVK